MVEIEDIFSPSGKGNNAPPQQQEAAPSPVQNPQQPPHIQPPEKKSRKSMWWGIGVALLVIVFGGTAFAMYQGVIPTPQFISGFFNSSKATAVAASIEKLMGIESARYETRLAANVTDRDTDVTPILFSELEQTYAALENTTPPSTSETVSQTLPDDFEIDLSFSGLFRVAEEADRVADTETTISTNVVFDAFSLMLDVDLRFVNQVLYIRFTTLPEIIEPFTEFIGITPEDINGVWISLESAEEFEGFGGLNITVPENENGVENESFIPTLQAVTKALLDEGLLSIEDTFADEQVDGVNTTHVRVGINPEKAAAAYRAAVAAAQAENPSADIPLDETTLAMLESESFIAFYTSLQDNSTFDIWIDEERELPIKMQTTTRFIPEVDAQFPDKQLNVTWSLTLTDINEEITIEQPNEVTTFEELFGTTFDEEVDDARENAKDTLQLSNVGQVNTALVLYYDDNNGVYPTTLDELWGVYISEPIKDVYTEEDFVYSPGPDRKTFSLQYELATENGSSISGLAYVVGTNTMVENGRISLEGGAGAYRLGLGTTGPLDADGDNLHREMEDAFGTDPENADTDGDGFDDYSEIINGYNPNGDGVREPLE